MTQIAENGAMEMRSPILLPSQDMVEADVIQRPYAIRERLARVSRFAGRVVSGAVVAAEMLGNEVICVGATVAAELETHSVPVALGAFALTRFGLEVAGGVAAGNLAQTRPGKWLVGGVDKGVKRAGNWFNGVLQKLHMQPVEFGKPTSALTDGAIALAAGTGVAVLNKHRSEPNRTLGANTKMSLLYGGTNTLLTLPTVGLAAAEGAARPMEALAVGAGAVAVAGLAAVGKNVLRTRRTTKEDRYLRFIGRATPGEQAEGLTREEIRAASRDKRTQYATLTDLLSDKKMTVPFAVPVEYASWINPGFIAKHGYDMNKTLYCAIPQSTLAQFNRAEVAEAMLAMSAKGYKHLIIDHRENIVPEATMLLDHEVLDNLVTKESTPAATYQYNATCHGDVEAARDYETDPHVQILTQDAIDGHFDRIWAVYESRFQDLVDDHPIKGMLPRNVLYEQLKNPNGWTAVYIDDQGVIQSFGYAVSDISTCKWLNEAYMVEKAEGLPLIYMPGVATAKEAPGPVSTKVMRSLIREGVLWSGGDFKLTFECTNLSSKYIPLLTKRAFEQSGIAVLGDLQESRYLYQVLTLEQ